MGIIKVLNLYACLGGNRYKWDKVANIDFIWSSPPCPSHSKIRITQKNRSAFKPLYPDMKLYEEIIFLDNYFDGKYCVENVIPYYEPLITAKKKRETFILDKL
jgi:DNA (cytosine-5)-methyltransferase 1